MRLSLKVCYPGVFGLQRFVLKQESVMEVSINSSCEGIPIYAGSGLEECHCTY